jgi:hypothetical protein
MLIIIKKKYYLIISYYPYYTHICNERNIINFNIKIRILYITDMRLLINYLLNILILH